MLYRLLATVYVELGDAAPALKSAEAALDSLPADDPRGMKPYAQQAEARALALSGRNQEALTGINNVIESLLAAGSSADSFEVQRAQRYRAELLAQAGREAKRYVASRPKKSAGCWQCLAGRAGTSARCIGRRGARSGKRSKVST